MTGVKGIEVLFSPIGERVDSAPDPLLRAVGFKLDVRFVMLEAERPVCCEELLE